MEKVQIIILAGGKGVRMESIEPKALTQLKGKAFLSRILETIKTLNLPNEPIIVVGHQKEKILEALGDKYNYAHQHEQLGTAHAVLSAKDKANRNSEIILVLSADQPLISGETILEIIKKHKNTSSVITMAVGMVDDLKEFKDVIAEFGRIIRDKNNNIEKIAEVKESTKNEMEAREVNGAVYAFDGAWLWENIGKVGRDNVKKEYYLTDLIKIAHEQNKKIESVPMHNILELIQPNSKKELELLESLTI